MPVIAALRTTLATGLVVVACCLTTYAAGAAPAAAAAPTRAECQPLDLRDPAAVRDRAASVTDVFEGRVSLAEPRSPVGGGAGQADPDGEPSDQPTETSDPRTTRWQHAVTVESPFQGDLKPGDQVLIVTRPGGPAGGLGKLAERATYVFFVSEVDGRDYLLAEACAGTTRLPSPLTAEMRDRLDAALGPVADDDQGPDYTLSAPEDGTRATPSLGRLAAPGAAVALLGVLGLFLLARIGSRRG